MTTLQEQFEKDFPDKSVEEIDEGDYEYSGFTNWDLDLREYKNLERLGLSNNQLTSIDLSQQKELRRMNLTNNQLISIDLSECKNLEGLGLVNNSLTSIDFLNRLPNPEKLRELLIFDNNIQPTDISVFSKFVNLKTLRIGTTKEGLKVGRHNKFYGSLKSYQNLTKLEAICIEATDVNEGLEYLPESLVKQTKGRGFADGPLECSPHYLTEKEKEELKKEQEGYLKILLECKEKSIKGEKPIINEREIKIDRLEVFIKICEEALSLFSSFEVAKCKAIQDQLRPFDYDIGAWQLAHPEKMLIARPEYFTTDTIDSEHKRRFLKLLEYKERLLRGEKVIHEEDNKQYEINLENCEEAIKELCVGTSIAKEKWINALTDKITNSQKELQEVKEKEADKIKKITRLESKISELEQAKATISQQTQTEFQTQDKNTQTDLTMEQINESEKQQKEVQEQIKTQEQENEQLKEQIKKLEAENNKKTLYQKYTEKYNKK